MDKFVGRINLIVCFFDVEFVIYLVICRPFVGPLYCTMKNARRVTLIIYIIGVFYASPLMFEYEPYEERGLKEILMKAEEKFYRQKPTKLGTNPIFRWTYVLINALGVYVVPLSIIIILNRNLLLSIRSMKQRSAETSAPLAPKQGITIMLLATTVMLLVFRFPSATVSVMWLISAKMFVNDKPPFRLRKFHSIANLCATFNAATTFIMFMIYGTKFRAEFTRVYCCSDRFDQERENDRRQSEEQSSKKFFPRDRKRIQRQTTRCSSATTTSTSIGSLPSLRRFRKQQQIARYSLDQQHDVPHRESMAHQRSPRLPHRQLTFSEIECHIENPDRQSVASIVSERTCLKNFIYCR